MTSHYKRKIASMKQHFSYDSPMMTVLNTIADIVILNVLFLVCCIPIITIGPAQTGLYTAMRKTQKPEDNGSCLKAYFQGFKQGFGTICISWSLILTISIATGYYAIVALTQADSGAIILRYFLLGVFIILILIHSLLAVFHSQFQCTLFQLLHNCLLLLFSRPLHSILTFTLNWAPVALLLIATNFCIKIFPVILSVYYSLSYLLITFMWKKPLSLIIDHFNSTDNSAVTK